MSTNHGRAMRGDAVKASRTAMLEVRCPPHSCGWVALPVVHVRHRVVFVPKLLQPHVLTDAVVFGVNVIAEGA